MSDDQIHVIHDERGYPCLAIDSDQGRLEFPLSIKTTYTLAAELTRAAAWSIGKFSISPEVP